MKEEEERCALVQLLLSFFPASFASLHQSHHRRLCFNYSKLCAYLKCGSKQNSNHFFLDQQNFVLSSCGWRNFFYCTAILIISVQSENEGNSSARRSKFIQSISASFLLPLSFFFFPFFPSPPPPPLLYFLSVCRCCSF